MPKYLDSEKDLAPVIKIDKDRCISCHACITACPIKFCNDGSKDHVTINHNLCIGCGRCIQACSHHARKYIDDFDHFIYELRNNSKIIAIVAPSIATSFPDTYLRLNSWLKQLGVEAVFDVSFGAELAVRSYIEELKNNHVPLITQPCSVLVSYIEQYQPELIQYLAKSGSPMHHTMAMIKKNYPEYEQHKIAVLSPCLAKRREFNTIGMGDYNIGYKSIERFIVSQKINLDNFHKSQYDNPPAERAVTFSSPGGLVNTLKHWIPDIETKHAIRKIEGHEIFEYLRSLPKTIAEGNAPLIIDCLHCEKGCNAGPLTITETQTIDTMEKSIRKRSERMEQHYEENNNSNGIKETIEKYWTPELSQRTYEEKHFQQLIKEPTAEERTNILHSMHKYSDKDKYNCTACGYGCCDDMVKAIYNGINQPENCHFYLQKEAEYAHKEVLEQSRDFQRILEALPFGVVIVDANHSIIEVNPCALKLCNFVHEEILGKKCYELIEHDKNSPCPIMDLQEDSFSSRQKLHCAKGQSIPIIKSSIPIHYRGKSCILEAFLDIHEIEQAETAMKNLNQELERRVKCRTNEAEEARKEAQRANKAKSLFLANMSHEIRTPMNSILGFASLLFEDEPDPARKEQLQTVVESGHNLLMIINDILDFSKIESGKIALCIEPIPIKRFFQHTKRIFDLRAKEKNIQFTVSIDPDIPKYLNGDPVRINQVITNLTGNAIKFTEEGGVFIKVSYKNNNLIITIKDSGIGIPKEKQGTIFNPFEQADGSVTRKYGGTGLGLVITSRYIEMMNGQLEMHSEEGLGTVFTITLPLTQAVQSEDANISADILNPCAATITLDKKEEFSAQIRTNTKPEKPEKTESFTILLAEDMVANQKLIQAFLKNSNVKLHVANNGQEALDKLEADFYDLLLLDMQMPILDGMGTLLQLREHPEKYHQPYIVALTGNTLPNASKHYLQAGCQDFLAKPVPRKKILNLIEQRKASKQQQ